ncbi:hypothetical protein AXF42_Ash017223 [Apostasia shenzhenica]|uniref:Uncharacterized protein n=1 Tax=Apostasia shenzhenica TaxID=1088818 RepID=A0A2H9ZVF8_9ASPA|nr:hypothetical protein AXF42_Ash017223 [Apostasia shenzhenica]
MHSALSLAFFLEVREIPPTSFFLVQRLPFFLFLVIIINRVLMFLILVDRRSRRTNIKLCLMKTIMDSYMPGIAVIPHRRERQRCTHFI